MRMQVMRCLTTGDIKRIFDLESVECIELSDDGRLCEVTLKSGKTFTACELTGFSETTPEMVIDSFAEKFALLQKEDANV